MPCTHLVVEVPGLVVCLRAPPVEDGPEVDLHQLPLGAMADVAEDPGEQPGKRFGFVMLTWNIEYVMPT